MVQGKAENRNWLFWLTMFAVFCGLTYILRSVLLPFVAGIVLGYLLDPWAAFFEKKGLNRTLATFLVLLIVVLVMLPVFAMVVGIVDEQVSRFLRALPQYVTAFVKKIEPVIVELHERFPSFDAEKIRDYLRSNMANNLKLAGTLVKGILSNGFAFLNLLSLLLITPVVAFYMLRDWDSFVAKVDGLLPRRSKKAIREQAREIDRTLAGFIRGQLSVCLLLGAFYSMGLFAVGLELGIVVGFMSGLISFIPYVGSISGFVVSIGIALAQFDSMAPVLMVAAVFVCGQFLEGNFLTPKLVGDSVGLHPVWIMFALLAGGVLLGFLGMLIAIPTAAIIGVLIRHAIENYKHSSLYLEG